ncbi:MAG TPA: hypothetical protein VHR86_03540 [Armatimonadota bacterium]|nr:hypothetical protein [Armatimonadota bacterium]
MGKENGANGMLAIFREAGAQHLRVQGAAPFGRDTRDLRTVRLGDIREAIPERTDASGKNMITRRERIYNCCFKTARTGRGENNNIIFCLEGVLESFDDFMLKRTVFSAAMVDHRASHR